MVIGCFFSPTERMLPFQAFMKGSRRLKGLFQEKASMLAEIVKADK